MTVSIVNSSQKTWKTSTRSRNDACLLRIPGRQQGTADSLQGREFGDRRASALLGTSRTHLRDLFAYFNSRTPTTSHVRQITTEKIF